MRSELVQSLSAIGVEVEPIGVDLDRGDEIVGQW